jgi:conjugal transfer pilus assembly protein TraU
MKLVKKLLAVAALCLSASAQAVVPAACTGKLFNPMTDTDWNNIFPITIAGVPLTGGGNKTSPLMAAMPPVCLCPTVLGIPFIGIGITYWQPLFVSEVERRPGCLSSLGGINVLPGYSQLHSEQSNRSGNRGGGVSRMQVHWYEYPVFGMMDMMKSVSCKAPSGFNLSYVTEIDPLWQDDLWGAIFSPESAIFANPVATAACAVDAVASSLSFPLDSLFWCAGSWGNVYPLSGNSSHTGDPFTMNNQLQAKFIARNHRMGLAWQTVGPTAICSSHPNPVWVKSQYRYNQVAPISRRGRAVTTGSDGRLFQFPPITNVPTQEHTVNLIWQGQQCCLKPIP